MGRFADRGVFIAQGGQQQGIGRGSALRSQRSQDANRLRSQGDILFLEQLDQGGEGRARLSAQGFQSFEGKLEHFSWSGGADQRDEQRDIHRRHRLQLLDRLQGGGAQVSLLRCQ